MATRQVDEDYDETTAIKRSYSQELGSSSGQLYGPQSSGISKRYIVAIMAFLGFANVYALRVNLSVAIVAMTTNRTTFINGTEVTMREFNWSPATQGLILSSFFYGYIITQIPAGWLASRYGGMYIYGGGILGTAVLGIITPPIARLSVPALVAIRVLQGLLEGVTYPCMHAIWAKWAPPLERSKLATIAFSGSYFGTVVSLPLSGVIADTIGWSWIFYIFGIAATVWFICWLWFISESPQAHPTISHAELQYIHDAIGFTDHQVKDQPLPWKDMFFSMPVWAIIMAHFAENWGFYTMLTELPTYLHSVYNFNLYRAGFLSAIPYLVMGIMVQVGGQIADLLRRREILSTTNTRKACNVTGFVGQAAFMLAVAYTTSIPAAVVCLSFGVGIGGLAWAGFSVNHLDIAPQFASILLGVSNTFATIPGIISPLLTGHIVKNGLAEEWRVIFYLAAAIYVFGAILYLLFASGKQQPWADVPLIYQPQLAADDTHCSTDDYHGDSEGYHGDGHGYHQEVDEAEDEH